MCVRAVVKSLSALKSRAMRPKGTTVHRSAHTGRFFPERKLRGHAGAAFGDAVADGALPTQAYRGRDRRAVPVDAPLPVGRLCLGVALVAALWGGVIVTLRDAGLSAPVFALPVVRLDVGASLLASVSAAACFLRWRLDGIASAFWAGLVVLVLGLSGFLSSDVTRAYGGRYRLRCRQRWVSPRCGCAASRSTRPCRFARCCRPLSRHSSSCSRSRASSSRMVSRVWRCRSASARRSSGLRSPGMSCGHATNG